MFNVGVVEILIVLGLIAVLIAIVAVGVRIGTRSRD